MTHIKGAYLQEMPKHKSCGGYYSIVGQVIQNKSDKASVDLGLVYHCKHCDNYSFGNKEFTSHKELGFFIKKKNLELIAV